MPATKAERNDDRFLPHMDEGGWPQQALLNCPQKGRAVTMDFAFVPGTGDVALDILRAVYSLRPNTTLDTFPSVATVSDFLGDLYVVLGVVGATAEDLFVGAHGSAEGQLQLSLDSKIPTPDPTKQVIAVYEDLEAANTSGSIRIPPEIESANTSFRLAGCLIGSDGCLPFLKMLKQALGNPHSVSAPRYIHSFYTAPDGASVFEFMSYAYRIVSKEPLKTRDAIIGTFGQLPDVEKQMLDGSAVLDDNWEQWVPAPANLNLAPATSQNLPFDFPVKISPAAGGMSSIYQGLAWWYSTFDRYGFKVKVSGTIPVDEAGQIALVPVALANKDNFKSAHLYPVYSRYHFPSMQEFVAGFNWKPTLLADNTLLFIGKRYRYELHIPVLKPGTPDELIYNFYPISGAAKIYFTENNQPYRLFGVV